MYERIHHVQLLMPPSSEDAARSFYVDVLGLAEIQKPPVLAARGGCWFRAGGVELHLSIDPLFSPATKAHPGLLVSDLEGLALRLRTAGQHAAWDTDFPGMRRFYARDPFGNRLEFLEPRAD